jgi:hypothetical protein
MLSLSRQCDARTINLFLISSGPAWAGLRLRKPRNRCVDRRADADQIGGLKPLGALQYKGMDDRRQQHRNQDHSQRTNADQRGVERRSPSAHTAEKDRTDRVADHKDEQRDACC